VADVRERGEEAGEGQARFVEAVQVELHAAGEPQLGLAVGAKAPVPVLPVWRLRVLWGWARSAWSTPGRPVMAWAAAASSRARACQPGSGSARAARGSQRRRLRALRSRSLAAHQPGGQRGQRQVAGGRPSEMTAKGRPAV
jgi:hypothetical protein